MKTILTPVDFSPITSRVCATAVALAKAVKARVVLVHSVPPPVMVSDYGSGVMAQNYGEIALAAEKASARQLARTRSKLRRSVPVATVQASASPVGFILAQAKVLRADYIVMGSHGHTALYELLAGSTAHGVLLKATCPVVVVPPAARKPAKKK